MEFESNCLPMVYSTAHHPTHAATTDSPANSTYTLPLLHLSSGMMMNGITIAPNLPPPEHIPKPLARVLVSNDSVVSGYRIWKTSFMKKRAKEPINTHCHPPKHR